MKADASYFIRIRAMSALPKFRTMRLGSEEERVRVVLQGHAPKADTDRRFPGGRI
jgi:hypothetical protein